MDVADAVFKDDEQVRAVVDAQSCACAAVLIDPDLHDKSLHREPTSVGAARESRSATRDTPSLVTSRALGPTVGAKTRRKRPRECGQHSGHGV